MDVGERLDALENRLAVIERALKITPPSKDVTITPPGLGLEDRVGKIEDALASLILDVEQMGQTAGKIAELEIDVSTASAKRKAKK